VNPAVHTRLLTLPGIQAPACRQSLR
jgi:hypothetical protein